MTIPKGYDGVHRSSNGRGISIVGGWFCLISFFMFVIEIIDTFYLDPELGAWLLPVAIVLGIVGLVLVIYGKRRGG